jgi:PKD repeat protein
MNVPEIYLVEPYNAYAPKQKKKHWMQEVEEQALLARILAEQQVLKEAAAKIAHPTLPPQAPPTSQATYQAYSGGEGAAGGPNTTGGGGSQPRPQFFNPESGSSVYTFIASPTTSSSPSLVQFSVLGGGNTFALGGASVNWNFGDGTTGNSPSHLYTSTGSFYGSATVISTYNGTVIGTGSIAVTMSVPIVSSAFTVTGATITGQYTASVGDNLTFVNGATTNNSNNPLTYIWNFSSASLTSTATNPTFTFTTASTYAVSLGVSGSFNTRATSTLNVKVV